MLKHTPVTNAAVLLVAAACFTGLLLLARALPMTDATLEQTRQETIAPAATPTRPSATLPAVLATAAPLPPGPVPTATATTAPPVPPDQLAVTVTYVPPVPAGTLVVDGTTLQIAVDCDTTIVSPVAGFVWSVTAHPAGTPDPATSPAPPEPAAPRGPADQDGRPAQPGAPGRPQSGAATAGPDAAMEAPDGQVLRVVVFGDDDVAHVLDGLRALIPSGQQGNAVAAGTPLGQPGTGDPCTVSYGLAATAAVTSGDATSTLQPLPYLQAWLEGDVTSSPTVAVTSQS